MAIKVKTILKWDIHVMEHYLAIKVDDTIAQVSTWMNLEDAVVHESGQ